jgi:hypothetical protein
MLSDADPNSKKQRSRISQVAVMFSQFEGHTALCIVLFLWNWPSQFALAPLATVISGLITIRDPNPHARKGNCDVTNGDDLSH